MMIVQNILTEISWGNLILIYVTQTLKQGSYPVYGRLFNLMNFEAIFNN